MNRNSLKYRGWFFRFLFFIVGQFLAACGIVFAKNSNLGVSAGSSFPTVLNKIIIDNVGSVKLFGGLLDLSRLGDCTMLMFWGLVLIQIIMLRKKFGLRNFLQFFGSTVFGVFVNVANSLFANLIPTTYITRLMLLLLSVLIQAFGIAIYIDGKIMLMPPEGIVVMINTVWPKIKVGTAKIIEDLTLVVIAFILSVLFLHTIYGIREGTIILAVAVGPIMGVIHKFVEKPLKKLFFPERYINAESADSSAS